MSGNISLYSIGSKVWEKGTEFVLNHPLRSIVYSVALTILGLSARYYLYPLGLTLFISLCTVSLFLDILIAVNINNYTRELITKVKDTVREPFDRINNFVNTYVSPNGIEILKQFFKIPDNNA